jgi:5-methylthioadenosine/S-adenosylhomocysteine deaminase
MRLIYSLLVVALSLSAAESVDAIWSARYVVTMDQQRRLIDNGAVAVRGDRIVAVGPRTDIDRQFAARRRLDAPDGILSPGFIDTHTHAAMSLLRGIADDKALQDWLQKYIFPAEARNVDAEFVRWGTRLACLEMALNGTTTYTDMYYFEDVVAEATKEAGLRGVLGQTIIGFPAPDYKTPQAGLAGAEKYIQRFKSDSLITPAVAPHAIYTTPDEILRDSRALAGKYQVPLLIHLSETRAENQESKTKRNGMSPARALESLGVLDGPTLAAHGVWLDDSDIEVLARHGTGVAHCPTSNTKLASGVARVADLLKAGVPVGLGTDGFAGSNDNADLMSEMALASKLQKVTRMDPEALPAPQAIEMATITGARALGLEKQIGSLEPGKRADMIVLRLDQPRAHPLYNIYSLMVYSLKAGDVSDVMVNGTQIVRSHRMLTLDPRPIFAKAKEFQTKISSSLTK